MGLNYRNPLGSSRWDDPFGSAHLIDPSGSTGLGKPFGQALLVDILDQYMYFNPARLKPKSITQKGRYFCYFPKPNQKVQLLVPATVVAAGTRSC